MLLEGRVAIVSGVGPGIGREAALAFAREGAHVVLGARTEERLREVAADVEALGRKAVWRATNIVEEDDCRALADAARDAFGRIDVLVNNAFMQPRFETVADGDLANWDRAFRVNVVGTLRMTRAVLPAMRAQRSGSIVMVSSMSARIIEPTIGAYAATKAAMLTVVKTMAVELGPEGIRINAVVPGYVWGPNLEWYFGTLAEEQGRSPQQLYDEVAGRIALRRIPDSAEVADACVFLGSDLARAVTGQALDVNGGHWFG